MELISLHPPVVSCQTHLFSVQETCLSSAQVPKYKKLVSARMMPARVQSDNAAGIIAFRVRAYRLLGRRINLIAATKSWHNDSEGRCTSSSMLAYLKSPSLSAQPGKSKRREAIPCWSSASAMALKWKPFLWEPSPWQRMAAFCTQVVQCYSSSVIHQCEGLISLLPNYYYNSIQLSIEDFETIKWHRGHLKALLLWH